MRLRRWALPLLLAGSLLWNASKDYSAATKTAFLLGALVSPPEPEEARPPEEVWLWESPLEPEHLDPASLPSLTPPPEPENPQPPRPKKTSPPRPTAVSFSLPVSGKITSFFGPRGKGFHQGVDIGAPYGSSVRAAAAGTVTFAGWYYGYGKLVIIRHPSGEETWYGHNSALLVSPGQQVVKGEVIARVGATGHATGPHVHFEIRRRGKAIDPLSYMASGGRGS